MYRPLLLTVDFEMTGYESDDAAEQFIQTTRSLLQWFGVFRVQSTFFCLGSSLKKFPDLIQEIASAGHEIACHGWSHTPLDKLSRDELKKDLDCFLEYAAKLDLGSIRGYRAPFFSLNATTTWAIDIIQQAGFSYDSSVVPVKTVLYGYPEISPFPHKWSNGLIEVPVSVWQPLSAIGLQWGIPVLGGTYLRLSPFCAIESLANNLEKTGYPIVSYFHPYDIDPRPNAINAFDNKPLYNALLGIGRNQMQKKISLIIKTRNAQTIRAWIETNKGIIK